MEPASQPYIVVVGVDYSDASKVCLERALELASREPGGEVHVISVVRGQGDNVFLELAAGIAVVSQHEAAERLRRHVEQRVAEFAARQAERGAPVCERIVAHLGYGSPADEIAQLASDLEADLVVVGTHGHRGLQRLMLGSVAELTVRLAPAPVLVVRPKHAAVDVPKIQPPCPRCVEARQASGGQQLWCAQHLERHGRRHVYHHIDRNSSSHENMPLVMPE